METAATGMCLLSPHLHMCVCVYWWGFDLTESTSCQIRKLPKICLKVLQ